MSNEGNILNVEASVDKEAPLTVEVSEGQPKGQYEKLSERGNRFVAALLSLCNANDEVEDGLEKMFQAGQFNADGVTARAIARKKSISIKDARVVPETYAVAHFRRAKDGHNVVKHALSNVNGGPISVEDIKVYVDNSIDEEQTNDLRRALYVWLGAAKNVNAAVEGPLVLE